VTYAHVFQIVGVDHITFLQKNTLNRRTRTLSIVAYNESFSSRILINEHCFYSVQTSRLCQLLCVCWLRHQSKMILCIQLKAKKSLTFLSD